MAKRTHSRLLLLHCGEVWNTIESMPIVRVEFWPGQTLERRRKIAREITKTIADNVGCPAEAVSVLFAEVPQENWALGGEMASDRLGPHS
jgi:4-oxalocrotonate tautomerase